MLQLFFAVALIAAPPENSGNDGSSLRDAVRELARDFPRSSHTEPDEETILRMVALHDALTQDTELPKPERDRLQREIAGRLEQAAALIKRRLVREEGTQRKSVTQPARVPESVRPASERSDVLAQPAGGPQPAGQAGVRPPVRRGSGVRGNATLPDNGPALVALIQRTISPGTWDVNGGEGTVHYYRPLRVLVIRAPGGVHDKVGGVLGGLRN